MDQSIEASTSRESAPRERLFLHGANSLATEELLSLVLKTGGPSSSAETLANEVLHKFGGLRGIANADARVLAKYRKLGAARAAQLTACIELGRRLASKVIDLPKNITSPDDAAEILRSMVFDNKKEQFFAIMLDTRANVLQSAVISLGTLNSTVVHPREVFRDAIKCSADTIIVGHNHPSGDPEPSPPDISMTSRLVEAGKLLGILVSDHIILGNDTFVSFKRRGLMR